MVNVFSVRSGQTSCIGLCARCNFIESNGDFLAFFLRENSNGDDRSSPGAVKRHFLRQHAAVETEGALEFVEGGVRAAFEKSAPHFLFAWSSHQAFAFCGSFLAGSGSATEASWGTVIGSAKRLINPSASLGL